MGKVGYHLQSSDTRSCERRRLSPVLWKAKRSGPSTEPWGERGDGTQLFDLHDKGTTRSCDFSLIGMEEVVFNCFQLITPSITAAFVLLTVYDVSDKH